MTQPAQYISGRTVQEQMDQLISYVDTRAAEVATDAIAADVAQVHQDMLDADADAAAAAASAAAAAGTLANAVKKTGEASQSIAGDVAVAGALSGGSVSSSGNVNGASTGSGATPVTAGDLTAFGNVSLNDTALQGNVSVANSSALINLSGAGSVLVPAPSSNSQASTKKYVDDSLDNYSAMVRTTGNQSIAGAKTFTAYIYQGMKHSDFEISQQGTNNWVKVFEMPTARRQVRGRFVSTDALAFFIIDNSSNTSPIIQIAGWGTIDAQSIALTYDNDATSVGIWFKTPSYSSRKIFIDEIGNYGGTSDFSYITKVTPLQYVSAPSGDNITYSSVWSPIA